MVRCLDCGGALVRHSPSADHKDFVCESCSSEFDSEEFLSPEELRDAAKRGNGTAQRILRTRQRKERARHAKGERQRVESPHVIGMLRKGNRTPTLARFTGDQADWLREAVKLYAHASKAADNGGDVGMDYTFRTNLVESKGAIEVRGDLANWRALHRAMTHYVYAVQNVLGYLHVARPAPYVRTARGVLRKVAAAEARAHAVASESRRH